MRAVGYCRYSTENQDDNSIAYQLEAIQKHCLSHGFVLTNIYTDEARSGTNLDREGFRRMEQDAGNKMFDAVIFYDQSRLSRNVIDWFTLRDKFRQMNIQLLSCTETIGEADNPASFLSESMKAIISQHFVMETRKKSMAGTASRARECIFLGGIAPLGYDIADGKYCINEHEAGIVRLIFELYAAGYGYKYICGKMKEHGYKSKRGGEIGTNALIPILNNERYIGTYFWNKIKTKYFGKYAGGGLNPDVIKVENGIPAIIDKNLWDEVHKRMGSNLKARDKTNKVDAKYLLSGLIRCDKCGSAFSGNYKRNSKGLVTRYYTCSNRLNRKGCDCKAMNASELEVLVVTLLKNEFLNSDIIERSADMIIGKLGSAVKDKKKQIGDLKKQASEIGGKIHNLLKAVAEGMPGSTVREMINNLEREKALLEQSIIDIEASPEDDIDRDKLIKRMRQDSYELINEPEKLRDVVKKYITKIVISDTQVEITSFGDVVSKDNSGRGT